MLVEFLSSGAGRDAVSAVLSPIFGLLVWFCRSRGISTDRLMDLTAALGVVLLTIDQSFVVIPYAVTVVGAWLILRYRSGDKTRMLREMIVYQALIIVVLNTLSLFVDVAWSHRSSPFMIQLVRAHMTAAALQYADVEAAGTELSTQQKRCILRRIPSFHEFLCYSFYFASVAYGPAIEFVEWRAFMDGPEAEAERPLDPLSQRAFSHRPARVSHSRVLCALSDIACSVVGATLYVTHERTPFHALYITSPAFLEHGPFFRLFVTPIVHRIFASGKYLFAWSLTAAGTTLAGFGKRQGIWGAFRSLEPSGYIGPSFSEMNVAWNLSINAWLRYYIYEPLRTSKAAARIPTIVQLLLPFAVSALWHGFNWFYFVTFIPAALGTQFARQCRRTFTILERRVSRRLGRGKPAGLALDMAYFVVCTLCSQWLYGFLTFFFFYRGNSLSLAAMARLHYLGYVALAIGLGLPWTQIRHLLGITPEEQKLLSSERGWCFAQYEAERTKMAEAQAPKQAAKAE